MKKVCEEMTVFPDSSGRPEDITLSPPPVPTLLDSHLSKERVARLGSLLRAAGYHPRVSIEVNEERALLSVFRVGDRIPTDDFPGETILEAFEKVERYIEKLADDAAHRLEREAADLRRTLTERR